MVVASLLLALVLGLAFTSAGFAKITEQPVMVKARTHLRVRPEVYRAIGVAEMLAAVGVILGVVEALNWLGYVSAFGIMALMVAAIVLHVTAEDEIVEIVPAAVLALLAFVYSAAVTAS